MAIPDYQSLMRPLLDFGADGSEKNINDAIKGIADQLNLTDEERTELLPSGKQAIFANRLHWARTYLDKAGAIKRTRRSHFQITERGKQRLAENPTKIDAKVLKQFPELLPSNRRKSEVTRKSSNRRSLKQMKLRLHLKRQCSRPKHKFSQLQRISC